MKKLLILKGVPLRKTQITTGEFYHIIKRGIERRQIFGDDKDRLRFINSLLVFNDKSPSCWMVKSFWRTRAPENLVINYGKNFPLVEIHAFVLMENHFHLLIRQIENQGLELFMEKLGGYARYFNEKYKRRGPLFEARYRAVHIKDDLQLRTVFAYIHTNPIELIDPDWKKKKSLKYSRRAIKFLEEEYRWSSYWDYLGKENFPSVLYKSFFFALYQNPKNIKKEIDTWIKSRTEEINSDYQPQHEVFHKFRKKLSRPGVYKNCGKAGIDKKRKKAKLKKRKPNLKVKKAGGYEN